jgi:hypothetical protein
MFATGIVFDVIGGVWFLAGIGLVGATCGTGHDCGDAAPFYGAFIGLGLVHFAIGIPLTVIGGRREPVAQAAWYVPHVTVGRRDAKAVWSFQF